MESMNRNLTTPKLSRSREKAPTNANRKTKNANFEHPVERETAGQAPLPYARGAPTSLQWWRGFPVTLNRETSTATYVLVVGPAQGST